MASELFAKVAFYPTLLYTITMSKLRGRPWYSRIDDTVILGALPLKHIAKQLIEEEGVNGLVTLNQQHETRRLIYTQEDWQKLGVEQLWISTVDFVGIPDDDQLRRSLEFIQFHKDRGNSVYVHCKAGRTRSTTVVACYLVQNNSWTPEEAVSFIKAKRPHIILMDIHWKCIRQFYERSR